MNKKEQYDFLITNIKGVGEQKANLILKIMPDNINLVQLTWNHKEIELMKQQFSEKFIHSFMSQIEIIRTHNELTANMVSVGISFMKAVEICKNEETKQQFLNDPYEYGKKNELDFKSCDKFATQFLKQDYSMAFSRITFLMDAMIQKLENSGHTYVNLQQLANSINNYQKREKYNPTTFTPATLLFYLENNDLISIEKTGDSIKTWRLYRRETRNLEEDLAIHILRLSNGLAWTNEEIEFNNDFFDDTQKEIINSLKTTGLKVITGPPGSGKTAVINGIIHGYKTLNPNKKIVLCAPTGRAAKHMSEITGEDASTIHRLMGINPTMSYIKRDTLHCDMLICDEASMLNLELAYNLLSRLDTETIVYFVGDKDQLPAVGPGNVLHNIIYSNVVPVYTLEKVYRQDGLILQNARNVNSGITPNEYNETFQIKSFSDDNQLKDDALNLFKQIYDPKDPYETQILIPSYQSDCGITSINQAIQNLNPGAYLYKNGKKAFKRNDKILMVRNHPDGLYQNGSIGMILSIKEESIAVEFDGEYIDIPIDSIDDMELGYATSVHKSQGSEFAHVILCLPDKPKNMLKRNVVYTGITRAKSDIVILEMNQSFSYAIKNNPIAYIQTGLKERLEQSSILS